MQFQYGCQQTAWNLSMTVQVWVRCQREHKLSPLAMRTVSQVATSCISVIYKYNIDRTCMPYQNLFKTVCKKVGNFMKAIYHIYGVLKILTWKRVTKFSQHTLNENAPCHCFDRNRCMTVTFNLEQWPCESGTRHTI